MEHLFFDLDHTLWDFEANAKETLYQLYDEFNLKNYSDQTKEQFVSIYNDINNKMWEEYNQGKRAKESLRTDRFKQTFVRMGVSDRKVPGDLWEHYLTICPTKTNLIDGSMELLDYLSQNYLLHIISNGFADTQARKLKNTGLDKYFTSTTISELIGFQKPHPEIFRYALRNAGSANQTGTFVGDNYDADVMGGINSGWHVFWLHKEHPFDFEHERLTKINSLRELHQFF
jgi:putative hydrolase of the HAD superfamily